MKIQNVLIVGGGTSGWFTAASLLKLCPHINVSLIESEDHPIIGVGESTLGQINDFFHLLELNDDEWMRETGSTYKVNIRFNDFYKVGETWDYPFGTSHERMYEMQHGWMSWFALNYHKPEKFHRGTFATTFNSVGHLAKYNKLTWQDRVWNPQSDSAYHMDATRMGQWFKKNRCKSIIEKGNYHTGTVVGATKDEHGFIKSVVTDDGRHFEADMFVDCTGFKSLLLEQELGVPFHSFHANDGGCLLSDRAIATHMPHAEDDESPDSYRKREVINTTNCTAIENGWTWDVPLWDRAGAGYVHSSDFATVEEAEGQLYNYLLKTRGKKRADQAEFKTIPFRSGKHEKSWYKNVCAVGLSNVFVEPLEATGLLCTHEQIIRLCTALSAREGLITNSEKQMVNLVCDLEIEGFKNFVASHYAFTARESPYWRAVSEDIDYDFTTGFNDNLFVRYASEKYVANEVIYNGQTFDDHNDGPRYVAAGMGFNPICKHTLELNKIHNQTMTDLTPESMDEDERRIDEWNEEMYNYCMSIPTSYEFQKNTIYKEDYV